MIFVSGELVDELLAYYRFNPIYRQLFSTIENEIERDGTSHALELVLKSSGVLTEKEINPNIRNMLAGISFKYSLIEVYDGKYKLSGNIIGVFRKLYYKHVDKFREEQALLSKLIYEQKQKESN